MDTWIGFQISQRWRKHSLRLLMRLHCHILSLLLLVREIAGKIVWSSAGHQTCEARLRLSKLWLLRVITTASAIEVASRGPAPGDERLRPLKLFLFLDYWAVVPAGADVLQITWRQGGHQSRARPHRFAAIGGSVLGPWQSVYCWFFHQWVIRIIFKRRFQLGWMLWNFISSKFIKT